MANTHKYPDGFTEEQLEQMETAAGMGLTVVQIGMLFNLSKTAFYEYIKQYPEIKERLLAGKSKTAFSVGKALYKKAISGDVAAIRWFEMTRLGKAEKSETTATVKSSVVRAPDKTTEEEWKEKAHEQPKAEK